MVRLKTNHEASGYVYRITLFLNGCVLYSIARKDAVKFMGDDMINLFEPMVESIQETSDVDFRSISVITGHPQQSAPNNELTKSTTPTTPGGPSTKRERFI